MIYETDCSISIKLNAHEAALLIDLLVTYDTTQSHSKEHNAFRVDLVTILQTVKGE